MNTKERLEEALAELLDKPFEIQELAKRGRAKLEETATFLIEIGAKPTNEGKFLLRTEDIGKEEEINREAYLLAYIKGWDAGFQRGFDGRGALSGEGEKVKESTNGAAYINAYLQGFRDGFCLGKKEKA